MEFEAEGSPEESNKVGSNYPRAGRASTLLRLAQVMERVGLKKTTIYALQKSRRFPHSVPLTGTAVRWVESEIEEWLEAKMASRDAKLQDARSTR